MQPLHEAVERYCIPQSSKVSMKLLWLLLESNADANSRTGDDGQTPLHIAASKGGSSVLWLLLANGADPKATDSRGRTALHYSVKNENPDICHELIQKVPSSLVHTGDRLGQTPLHAAAIEGNTPVLWMLLEHGADLRRVDLNRRTALHCAIQSEHAEICQILVQESNGYLVDSRDDERRSPLHHAASCSNLAIVGMLLNHEAPIDGQYGREPTALHVVVRQGHKKVVDALLERGANVHLASLKRKRTAAHMAAYYGHLEIVGTLLRHGAEMDMQDSKGHTPLRLAATQGHREVENFLVDCGADVRGLIDRDRRFPMFDQPHPHMCKKYC